MRCHRLLSLTAFGLIVMSASPAASQDAHAGEALRHAQAAAIQSRQGYPDELLKQAKEALQHAQQAAKGNSNPHLTSGIGALKTAIEQGRAGHADEATKAAEEAVAHLSQVTASTAETPAPETGY